MESKEKVVVVMGRALIARIRVGRGGIERSFAGGYGGRLGWRVKSEGLERGREEKE